VEALASVGRVLSLTLPLSNPFLCASGYGTPRSTSGIYIHAYDVMFLTWESTLLLSSPVALRPLASLRNIAYSKALKPR
jgi:hypothetical protein